MVTTDIMEVIIMRTLVASGILLSSLFLPAAARAIRPADDASAPTKPVVSTGLIAPMLLDTTGITITGTYPSAVIPVDGKVGLSLTVDENGKPQDIHVVQGINPFWDARVVEAVSKLRYHPGTIDAMPIPVDVNLTVTLTR
jgi:TonB family protein